MAGDALLPSPQGRDRTFPDLLELFAAVMLGRLMPDDTVSRMASDARRSAREAITSARAPVGSQEVLALRSIYDQVRALGPVSAPEATQKNAVLGRTRAQQAMEALLHLRHRQRAALVMHDVGSLAPTVVASVLGLTQVRTHGVVDAARAAMLARLPRPMNVRHVLRDAAERLISTAAAEIEVPRSPQASRGVVERLIAPPEGDSERSISAPQGGLLTAGLLESLEATPADVRTTVHPRTPLRPAPIRIPTRSTSRAHAWLAAACALLAVAVYLPASARALNRATPASAPATVPRVSEVATTTRVAAVAITVRHVVVARGDSLWAIASRTTGDAERWREIWRLNANRRMAGGVRFTDPALVLPGWRLRLPPGPR